MQPVEADEGPELIPDEGNGPAGSALPARAVPAAALGAPTSAAVDDHLPLRLCLH